MNETSEIVQAGSGNQGIEDSLNRATRAETTQSETNHIVEGLDSADLHNVLAGYISKLYAFGAGRDLVHNGDIVSLQPLEGDDLDNYPSLHGQITVPKLSGESQEDYDTRCRIVLSQQALVSSEVGGWQLCESAARVATMRDGMDNSRALAKVVDGGMSASSEVLKDVHDPLFTKAVERTIAHALLSGGPDAVRSKVSDLLTPHIASFRRQVEDVIIDRKSTSAQNEPSSTSSPDYSQIADEMEKKTFARHLEESETLATTAAEMLLQKHNTPEDMSPEQHEAISLLLRRMNIIQGVVQAYLPNRFTKFQDKTQALAHEERSVWQFFPKGSDRLSLALKSRSDVTPQQPSVKTVSRGSNRMLDIARRNRNRPNASTFSRGESGSLLDRIGE